MKPTRQELLIALLFVAFLVAVSLWGVKQQALTGESGAVNEALARFERIAAAQEEHKRTKGRFSASFEELGFAKPPHTEYFEFSLAPAGDGWRAEALRGHLRARFKWGRYTIAYDPATGGVECRGGSDPKLCAREFPEVLERARAGR